MSDEERDSTPRADQTGDRSDSEAKKIRVKSVHQGAPLWLIGWLFTIGFVDLSFWQGALALVIWPVYLGEALRGLT